MNVPFDLYHVSFLSNSSNIEVDNERDGRTGIGERDDRSVTPSPPGYDNSRHQTLSIRH